MYNLEYRINNVDNIINLSKEDIVNALNYIGLNVNNNYTFKELSDIIKLCIKKD